MTDESVESTGQEIIAQPPEGGERRATRPTTPALALTEDQIALVKRTICKPSRRDATDDELALFLHQAHRLGLDPLAGQIYAVFRYDRRAGGEVMTIQSSIDSMRLTAERSGKYAGQTPTYWADGSAQWHEIWLPTDEPPTAAKVGVYRRGAPDAVWGVARWASYAVTNKDGQLTPFWRRMPDVMIAKCAEAIALRRAFPAELSGVYADEEMEQADTDAPPKAAPAVAKGEDAPALPAPKVDELIEGLSTVKPGFERLCSLLGAAGADAPKLNRRDSIEKAIRTMTPEQAEEFGNLLNAEADGGDDGE